MFVFISHVYKYMQWLWKSLNYSIDSFEHACKKADFKGFVSDIEV